MESDILKTNFSQPSTPSQVPEAKKEPIHKNNNLLVILVALVLITLIGAGLFFLAKDKYKVSTETEDIANQEITLTTTTIKKQIPVNWKTYENKLYGFTFSYPSDWIILSEEGKPYDENDTNPNYTGFVVKLKKGDWTYSIAYNSYWDDISSVEANYIKELTITNKKRYRIGYMSHLNVIDFFQINEEEYYKKNINQNGDPDTWEGFGIMLNNKGFIVRYEPEKELTYDESKSIIEEMDAISETLTLISSTTQTPDPYAGWKEVKLFNNQYSIMIPQTWELKFQSATTPAPDLDIATASFTDTSVSETKSERTIALGNTLQTGDEGHVGGCDTQASQDPSETGKLFTITFLTKSSDIIVGKCLVNGKTQSRSITLDAKNLAGPYKNLSIGITLSDTTSSLEQLRIQYADLKKVLESLSVL